VDLRLAAHADARCAQVAADRHAMNARGVGDSPQRPTQTAERQNLLLFVMVQDVGHPGEGLHLRRRRQRLSRRQLIDGFQVSIKCRFWVSTEGARSVPNFVPGPNSI
jgi:hypothetical protein